MVFLYQIVLAAVDSGQCGLHIHTYRALRTATPHNRCYAFDGFDPDETTISSPALLSAPKNKHLLLFELYVHEHILCAQSVHSVPSKLGSMSSSLKSARRDTRDRV